MRHVIKGLALAAAVIGLGEAAVKADYIYGITENGRIARVDTSTWEETFLTGAQGTSGNGVAVDTANNRLLYRLSSTEKGLHALDLDTNSVSTISIAGLPGDGTNATYYDGAYWYVAQNTNDLYKATLSETTGTYEKVGDIGGRTSFNFGDIVITEDGTLYGSASSGFFSVDLTSASLTQTVLNASMPQLQIALLSDGSIIGQSYGSGQWYAIGTNGSYSAIQGAVTTGLRDVTATAVPEPASVAMMGLGGVAALAFARRRFRNDA